MCPAWKNLLIIWMYMIWYIHYMLLVVNILLFSFQFKHFGPIFWVIRYFEIFFMSSRTNGNIFMLSQTFPRKEKGNHSYLYNLSRLIEDILYKMWALLGRIYVCFMYRPNTGKPAKKDRWDAIFAREIDNACTNSKPT